MEVFIVQTPLSRQGLRSPEDCQSCKGLVSAHSESLNFFDYFLGEERVWPHLLQGLCQVVLADA